MIDKKYLFALIFFIVILSISSVGAAEDIASDIVGADNNELILEDNSHYASDDAIDETILEYYNANSLYDNQLILDESPNEDQSDLEKKTTLSKTDESTLSEDTGSFKDLNYLINANSDLEINLTRNYTYESSDISEDPDISFKKGIVISRQIILNGNGHTLNGNGKARIFHVLNSKVEFFNVTFINANVSEDKNGAAIWGEFTAINCTFINNTAGYGGAIYAGNAINCTFIENHAYSNGGAISYSKAENCSFFNNSAGEYGGAMDNNIAENCRFYNNSAKYGGAFYEGKIVNCSFTGNHAECCGGAVHTAVVKDSILSNNSAEGYGGALYGSDAENSTFYGNIAKNGEGGAMYRGIGTDSTFINNHAGKNAGAMYESTANKCKFYNNTAGEKGGAVYDCIVRNSAFIGNAASEGGAMYGQTAINSTFENNSAIVGGAIFNAIAKMCIFTSNKADIGLDIYKGTAIVSNLDYGNSYETNFISGALNVSDYKFMCWSREELMFDLVVQNETYDGFNVTIKLYKDGVLNGTYYGFTGEGWWEFIIPGVYVAELSIPGLDVLPVNISYISLMSASIEVGDFETTYDSGEPLVATLLDYNKTPVSAFNLTVELGGKTYYYITDENGKIYISSYGLPLGKYDVKIFLPENDVYVEKNASSALFINRGSSSIDADIVLNEHDANEYLLINMKNSYGNPISGAVVSVEFDSVSGTLPDDLIGVNNFTADENGQIWISTEGFENGFCTANIVFGGNENYNKSNINKAFVIDGLYSFSALNNQISSASGNIILLEHNFAYDGGTDCDLKSGIVIDRDNLFIDGQGHVIDGAGLASIFRINGENVTLHNMTLLHGNSSIYWVGLNGTISFSNFEAHTGSNYSAVYWNGLYGKILSSRFINNYVDRNATIYWENGFGLVDNCTFIGNHGGAIFWHGDNGTVNNSRFANNSAVEYAGAIFLQGKNARISNSNFTGNIGQLGGAIYCSIESGENNILNSIFNKNVAETYNNIYDCYGNLELTGCTFEATVAFDQVGNSMVGSSQTIGFSFDDGTNIGDYVLSLFNDGELIKTFAYDDSHIYQCTLGNMIAGSYLLSVNGTNSNGNVYLSNDSIGFNVLKYGSSLSIDPIDSVYYTENITVRFAVENRTQVSFVLKDGKGNILRIGDISGDMLSIRLGVGNYSIEIFNAENDTFYGSNSSSKFKVNKFTSRVSIEPFIAYVEDNFTICFKVDNKTDISYELKNSLGKVVSSDDIDDDEDNLTLGDLFAGTYTLVITNGEDYNYHEYVASIEFNVLKFTSSVSLAPIMSIYYDDDITVNFAVNNRTELSFELRKSDGQVIKLGLIKSNNLILSGLSAGSYILTIINKETYRNYGSSASGTFNVYRYGSVLSASGVSSVYNGGKYIVATLRDLKGNALSGVKLTIVINGKIKNLRTNAYGQVRLSINGLDVKKYTVRISFEGNEKYIGSSAKTKVTIRKAKVKLIAKSKKYTHKKRKIQYTVILKTNRNKPLKKVKVILKIKGKTYKVKTNKKGKAKFKIKNLIRNGRYKAIVKFAGNKYYKKISKKVKISIKRKY